MRAGFKRETSPVALCASPSLIEYAVLCDLPFAAVIRCVERQQDGSVTLSTLRATAVYRLWVLCGRYDTVHGVPYPASVDLTQLCKLIDVVNSMGLYVVYRPYSFIGALHESLFITDSERCIRIGGTDPKDAFYDTVKMSHGVSSRSMYYFLYEAAVSGLPHDWVAHDIFVGFLIRARTSRDLAHSESAVMKWLRDQLDQVLPSSISAITCEYVCIYDDFFELCVQLAS